MPASEQALLAAQVVLAGTSGDGKAAVAANSEAFRPAPAQAECAKQAFEGFGFRVGGLVGNSFSIEGGLGLFREVFGVQLAIDAQGRVRILGSVASSLPTSVLPAALRAQIDAVVFSEPPAFGPEVMP